MSSHARPSRRSGGPEKGCVHPGRLGPRTPGRQPGRPTAPVAIGTCKCRPPAIHANACLLPPAAFHGPGSLDAAQTPRAGVLASRPPTRNNALGRRSRRQPDWTCSACQTGNHAVHLLDVGELENPEDPEITKDKTERCGGARTSRSGGPWRTLRPAEGPRSGDHDGAQKTENGDASVAVAGPADLANHGVGGWATPRCSRRTRNQTPNKALSPTGAGGIVSAGG